MSYRIECASLSVKPNSTAEKIHAIALNLFVNQGFERVSVRELAAATKVHAGSLYNHIENKQSLLFDLIEEHESGLLATLSQSNENSLPPSATLKNYIKAYIQFKLNNKESAALARLELRSLSTDQRSSIAKIRDRYQRHLEVIFSNLNKVNAVDSAEKKIGAHCLLEMLNGLATALSAYPEAGTTNHLIECIQAMVSGAMVGNPSEGTVVENRTQCYRLQR